MDQFYQLCQFLLGTVQHTVNEIDKIVNVVLENVSIPLRYGTTVAILKLGGGRFAQRVSIPLRYGTTAVFSYYY